MVAATAFSKLLGMLRGILLASHYGTSPEATAFSAASRIPLSFFDILFGSAILGCFIPVYNSLVSAADERRFDEADKFAGIYLNFILLLTGIITALGLIFARGMISMLASGLDKTTFELAVRLFRIMLPLIMLAGSAYTLVGVLQSRGEFIFPSLISCFSNSFVIIYFLFFDRSFGIAGLAAAYLAAWGIQLVTLIIPLKKRGFRFYALFDFGNKAFLKALKATPKVVAGSWLIPFSLLIGLDFSLRSGTEGAVPAFEYATTLFIIAAGILTYGICNYSFPEMSRRAANEHAGNAENVGFNEAAREALFVSLLITLPVLCAMTVLSPNITAVIYMRGSFDVNSCRLVAAALKAVSTAIPAFAVCEVMSRSFYALGKNSVPATAALSGIVSDFLLSYLFVSILKLGPSSAAAAMSCGLWVSALVMLCCAGSIKGFFKTRDALWTAKAAVSAVLSYAVMNLTVVLIGADAFTCGFWKNAGVCAAVFIPGAAVYAVSLIIIREPYSQAFLNSKSGRKKA